MVKFMHEKYLKNCDIYTNFHLFFTGHKPISLLDMQFFKNYAESQFNIRNSVIAIDECHVFFDSRNAMLKRNKIFSKFVTQSRKRSVDLIYTTQDKSPELFFHSGQVELRLRKLTDFVIFCECIKHKGEKYIVQHICDRYGKEMKRTFFEAKPYFKLYDTDEIVDINFD